MKNILIDLNILLDYYQVVRREKFPDSVKAFEYLRYKEYAFISVSSLDNFEFLMYDNISQKYPTKSRREKLNVIKENIKEILSFFKISKTPSYIEIDFDDIEDSQIIASAKAIDALVLTRDEKMLEKYPDITITPTQYTNIPITNNQPPIDFANLKKQYFLYESKIQKEMDKVLNSASYILGNAVKELEENLCNFTGAKHAITCGSGTDALLLAMMALGIGEGDEVITTPFTFIATAETIALLGAKPVFVDIDEKTYNIDPSKIEEKITDKTKAIMPVSLYGQPADMEAIKAVVDKVEGRREKGEGRIGGQNPSTSKIKIIIDGAQSFGATYKGKAEVHYCDIYTTSFFPAKPLGCFGDGGAVLTNNQELAEKIKMLRVHGQNRRYHHKYIGFGARMDTLQCAITNVKLKHYKKDLALRQEVARKYDEILREKVEGRGEKEKFDIVLPYIDSRCTSAYAQYSIRITPSIFNLQPSSSLRDDLQAKLKEQGIPTAVHYPMPLHLQECFTYLGYKKGDFPISELISNEIMSLPMNPYLSDEEIEFITKELLNATNSQYTNTPIHQKA